MIPLPSYQGVSHRKHSGSLTPLQVAGVVHSEAPKGRAGLMKGVQRSVLALETPFDWSGKTLLGSASAVSRHKNTHSSSGRFRSVMAGCLRSPCSITETGPRVVVLSQDQPPLMLSANDPVFDLFVVFFLSKQWKRGSLALLLAY